MSTSRLHSDSRLNLFAGGGRWRAGLPGLAVLGLCLSAAEAQPPVSPVAPDFLRLDYGSQLPSTWEAGINGSIPWSSAAVAGTGGWLVAWSEASGFASEFPLKVRLLPPEFDFPPEGGGSNWTGGAEPALMPASLSGAYSFATAAAPGGAWLFWEENRALRAWWFSQAAGGPVGEPLVLNDTATTLAELRMAAGDGTRVWVTGAFTAPDGSQLRFGGSVLEVDGGVPKVKAGFTLPAGSWPEFTPTARNGSCLISTRETGTSSNSVRTVSVNAAGVVSPAGVLTVPNLGNWMGIAPDGGGYAGIWYDNPSPAGTLRIMGRAMTAEGTWREGSEAVELGSGPWQGGGAYLTPGPSSSVVYIQGSRGLLLKSLQLLALIPLTEDLPATFYSTPRAFAVDEKRILSVSLGGVQDRVTARRLYPEKEKPFTEAVLTEGAGRQSAPNLAWTRNGPQVVFQVSGYGPESAAKPVRGFNKRAGAPGGTALLHDNLSTSAQAWLGNTQLIAYRRANVPPVIDGEPTDPDDVMGVFYTAAADGTLTQSGEPFVIAGGPGSQRGVSVTTYGNSGFMAAWREETGRKIEGNYLSTVRAAFIDQGSPVVRPAGGWLVDVSRQELSAVYASGNSVVWKGPQKQDNSKITQIRVAEVSTSGGAGIYRVLSPAAHNAVAPGILRYGDFYGAVWRDKASNRIFVSTGYNLEPAEPVGVSAIGALANEPVLVPLSLREAAVLWLEQISGNRTRLMAALVNREGTVGPPVVVTEGAFYLESLAAAGDGQGRIAVGLEQRDSATADLKILMFTPVISRQGGLLFFPSHLNDQISWTTSSLFPAKAETLEMSADLIHWGTPEGIFVSDQFNQSSVFLQRPAGDVRRYYRLRAALNPVTP